MWKTACLAAALAGVAAAAGAPALAGERHHHAASVVVHVDRDHNPPWYRQRPWIGTGVGHYYSYHPRHIPGYPHDLNGYPVPIYRMADTDPLVRAFRGLPVAHVRWCLARYRSYDPASDTFQPYHGPRRVCVSPYP